MERLNLPDLTVHILETRPDSDWQYDAVVVSPAVGDVPRWKVKQQMAELMLESLWDEQSRVGGLFAYTPEEYGGASSGDDE